MSALMRSGPATVSKIEKTWRIYKESIPMELDTF